jgi:8-oxo-dGTP pyrophosphatase MutT (NUDIX family)
MQPWKTLSRRQVYAADGGKFLRVEEHTVQLPDQRVIEPWPWLVMPDFANIVVVTEDGRFLCFRQTKYAAEGETLAVVGGYLEPGEDALAGAQRELLEETGYVAAEWLHLGSLPVDGNRGAGVANLYLATGARKVQEIHADDLEEQEILFLSRADIEAALLAGQFKILSWAANVALALVAFKLR